MPSRWRGQRTRRAVSARLARLVSPSPLAGKSARGPSGPSGAARGATSKRGQTPGGKLPGRDRRGEVSVPVFQPPTSRFAAEWGSEAVAAYNTY